MPVSSVNSSTSSGDSGAEPDSISRTGPSRSRELLDVAPVGEDRRRDRDDAAGLVLDQVEGALRVEARGQHQLGPVLQHDAEDGVEAVDVEQRQHAEHDVVAVDHRRLDGRDLLDVGEQRAVGEHRGARAARRTAGVEQRGELLGVLQRRDGVRARRRAGGRRSARPGWRVAADHDDARVGPAARTGRASIEPAGWSWRHAPRRAPRPRRGPRSRRRRRRPPSASRSRRSSGPARRRWRSG